jgi:membrane-associated phospholipid phosphatase
MRRHACGVRVGVEGDLHSFLSAHTTRVLSAAAAAAQIARLRGRTGWRWIAAAGLVAATGTAWLRVAGDQHWTSDVLASAAAGTALGVAVPALALRGGGEHRTRATLAPAPGGLALVF